ncbi:MAG: hypothetical protein K6E85_17380 [Lachnospiraceae bacterium]|nr:hypothetical protein [Lachnospiraceae bacterium]
MKDFKGDSGKVVWKTIVLPILLCIAMLAVMIFAVIKFNQMSMQQDRELTLAAVRKAAVQCYADEGRYPSTLDYLVENYGITIDEDTFMVTYDCAAANVFPNISVFRK